MSTPIPPSPTVIGCCVCLNVSGKRGVATVLVNGHATCESHADLVGTHGLLGAINRARRAGNQPVNPSERAT